VQVTLKLSDPVVSLLGEQAERLAQGLECWTSAIIAASRENEKAFYPEEWCFLADVCNGYPWELEESKLNPGTLMALEVADAHKLGGAGYRWFGEEEDELAARLATAPTESMKQADARVRNLVLKLNSLDYVHGCAVALAVSWFWDHPKQPITDPWWTVDFRLKYRKQAEPVA
jgi:hypothetical protein